jgi:hypothetical protein
MPFGPRGSAVGWVVMSNVGRSRIRFSMRSLDVFNLLNPSIHTTGQVLTAYKKWVAGRFLGYSAAGAWEWQLRHHMWAGCLEHCSSTCGTREHLTSIKMKHWNRLNLKPGLIPALKKIRLRNEVLTCQKQAQSSQEQVRTTLIDNILNHIILH